MNLCPCGYLGDPEHECRCGPGQIQQYRNRLSGPLLDRFDLHIAVPRLPWSIISGAGTAGDPDQSSKAVAEARRIQFGRGSDNARLESRDLDRFATPNSAAGALLERAVGHYRLSARAYFRILRVARTIADLEAAPKINEQHVAEAINFRLVDRFL